MPIIDTESVHLHPSERQYLRTIAHRLEVRMRDNISKLTREERDKEERRLRLQKLHDEGKLTWSDLQQQKRGNK